MMQHMMPNSTPGMMMPGMVAYTLFYIVLALLLCLLVARCIWLFTRWLKQRGTLPVRSTAQPKDAYQDYQQGYQAQQPFPETYEEGGQIYPYAQEEQLQLQPPQLPRVG
jgi:hypothetical protein